MGIHRSGFRVIGYDIVPQKNYPFDFRLGDALNAPLDGADLVWASPPCQAYSHASKYRRNAGKIYPDLLSLTREKLIAWGGAWVIENTPGAPMRADAILCGSMFGLRLIRHRLFESNHPDLFLCPPCQHPELAVCVVGSGTPSWVLEKNGGKGFGVNECREAMGIEWMTRKELSLAIPPAYSEFICIRIMKRMLAKILVA